MSGPGPSVPSLGGPPSALLNQIAEVLYGAGDFAAIQNTIVQVATELVDGCHHASLMLKRGNEFATVAATDDVARQIDDLERRFGEGPCLDAIVEVRPQLETDFSRCTQWPELSKAIVSETNVRCGAGFRLVIDDAKVGALNLFGDEVGCLDEASVDQAVILASFASVAISAAQSRDKAETLARGLDSNREIGKAIGLLMAFHKISDAAAFEVLRKASQDMNIKISQVAKQLVDHHNIGQG